MNIMENLTRNESIVIDFLIRNITEKYSINQIGRKLNLSPRGIYKILKKMEKNKIAIPEKLSNAIYYKLDLENEETRKLAELVLLHNELNSYSKVIADDFEPLKEVSLSFMLFGSILDEGIKAHDIDVLLIIKKENFKIVNSKLKEIKELSTKKIHDVMMTKEDLARNIRKKDVVVLDILKKGAVLYGSEIIVGAVKNGTS